jgi:methionine synthase II (cobalamin-independent)
LNVEQPTGPIASSRLLNSFGPKNVIAGTDCGFSGRVHPQIVCAKLPRPEQRRNDREQGFVEFNSKVSVRDDETQGRI